MRTDGGAGLAAAVHCRRVGTQTLTEDLCADILMHWRSGGRGGLQRGGHDQLSACPIVAERLLMVLAALRLVAICGIPSSRSLSQQGGWVYSSEYARSRFAVHARTYSWFRRLRTRWRRLRARAGTPRGMIVCRGPTLRHRASSRCCRGAVDCGHRAGCRPISRRPDTDALYLLHIRKPRVSPRAVAPISQTTLPSEAALRIRATRAASGRHAVQWARR